MEQLHFLYNFYKSFPISFGDSQEGHCDAFAIALRQFMQTQFPEIDTSLMVVERTRINERKKKDNVLEFNPLSHVCLKIGSGFNSWDSQGDNAVEVWGENWTQPDKSEYGFKVTDYFDEKPISQEELEELRLLQDQRTVDSEKIEKFKNNIKLEFENTFIKKYIQDNISWAAEYYQSGGCHEMAVAFHRLYGWKMAVIQTDLNLHVVALSSDGLAWDSDGISPLDEKIESIAKKTWSRKKECFIFEDEKQFQEKYVEQNINDVNKPLSLYSEKEIERATHVILDVFKEKVTAYENKQKSKIKPVKLKPL